MNSPDHAPSENELRIRSLLEESARRADTPLQNTGTVEERLAASVARSLESNVTV